MHECSKTHLLVCTYRLHDKYIVGLSSPDGCKGLGVGLEEVEPVFKVVKCLQSSSGCNALLCSMLVRAELAWTGPVVSQEQPLSPDVLFVAV